MRSLKEKKLEQEHYMREYALMLGAKIHYAHNSHTHSEFSILEKAQCAQKSQINHVAH
jgi:hypothetical protein